jgi:hypothetical protein
MKMANSKIKINRAPVLTLWAVVVAERLGYDRQSALSLGKAVAGLNAQSKGKRLGIYSTPDGPSKPGRTPHANVVTLLGRPVPTIETEAGIRAAIKGEPINPESVERYLLKKFGDRLDDARTAMEILAKALDQEALAEKAYPLYERFRPEIPKGKAGWGAAGELDLSILAKLAES